MGTVSTIMPLWHVLRGGLEWLLYDEFTTDDTAPITSPRTCEPGPGTLTTAETDGSLAISSSELVFVAQTTPVWGDLGFYGSAQTRAAGLALSGELNLTTWEECGLGWHTATAIVDPDSAEHAIQANTTDGQLDDENATPVKVDLSTSTNYRFLMPLRSVGCFYIVNGELLWVANAGATAALYPMFSVLDGAGSLDDLGVIALPANGYTEWDEDFSTVTDSETNPPDATSVNCDADCHVRFTHTAEAGTQAGFFCRALSSSAYGFYAVDVGGALRVYERLSGQSSSQLGSSLGAYTDGVNHQTDIVLEGTSAKVYVDNVLLIDVTVQFYLTTAAGEVQSLLATNDIVLSTHPYPALGIATDRLIAPQTTDTFTHTSDFLAYIRNVTLPAAGSTEYFFRITGADEITLQLASDGSLALLDNVTSRITAGAATISDGDDVALICEGADGEVFVAGTSAGSTSAIAVTTGTSGKRLDAQDGVADSIELFPRDVSSLLPGDLV